MEWVWQLACVLIYMLAVLTAAFLGALALAVLHDWVKVSLRKQRRERELAKRRAQTVTRIRNNNDHYDKYGEDEEERIDYYEED
jgi:membrane protein implicated in regulation of membrane protease activity